MGPILGTHNDHFQSQSYLRYVDFKPCDGFEIEEPCSGCGAVSRVVASDTRDPQFKSHH